MMPNRQVIFMGEKPLALRCLQFLVEYQGIEIVAVCTRRSDNVWWDDPNILDYCEKLSIPVITRSLISRFNVDYLISVLYPFIIERKYLEHAVLGCFNLHEAPLPRWKGCNGYSHAILSGDSEYATTLHEMSAELDDGAIISECRFAILPNETSKELNSRTAEKSYELFLESWPKIINGNYPVKEPVPSEESFVNARDSLKDFKEMSLDLNLLDVFQVTRALDFVPWEPAFLPIGGKKYYFFILDSLGREGVINEGLECLDAVSCLRDIQWSNLNLGVIGHLPRPLVICESSTYKQYFPLTI